MSSLGLVIVLVVVAVAAVILALKAASDAKVAERERGEIFRDCFLRGLAGLLGKMAQADGVVAAEEVKIATGLFAEMGLSEEERRVCVDTFCVAGTSHLPVGYYASLFVPYSSQDARRLIYEVLWDVTAADGQFDPKEEDFLHRVTSWLELTETDFERNRESHAGKFKKEVGRHREALARIGHR